MKNIKFINWQSLSIRKKLFYIVLLATILSLGITFLVTLTINITVFYNRLFNQIEVLVKVINKTTVNSLINNNPETINSLLSELVAYPEIEFSYIFNRDRDIIAQYSKSGVTYEILPNSWAKTVAIIDNEQRYRHYNGRLEFIKPIFYQKTLIGYFYLIVYPIDIYNELIWSILIALLLMMLTIILTSFFSKRLQHWIADPIMHLITTINQISNEQNYSLRVANGYSDEIGQLIIGFNQMLSLVEERDQNLARYRLYLKQEVAEQTKELSIANDELRKVLIKAERAQHDAEEARNIAENANRAKSQFLANMSHEIRSPMSGLMGMIALLIESDLNQQQQQLATTALQSGRALLNLFDDLLDIVRIETGKLSFHPRNFNLRESIEGIYLSFLQQAQYKGLKLTWSVDAAVPYIVNGDPLRLRQVLTNLIGNAIKFTSVGKVTINVALYQGDIIHFEVTDTGIGIPEEKHSLIFETFTQADNYTTRDYGGSGLGLAITCQIIELMGGSIDLASTVGYGSTFWFNIPLLAVNELINLNNDVNLSIINSSIPYQLKLKILVAEDNHVHQELILTILKRLDCQVTLVTNGNAVLEAVANNHFDVLLMDCQMPIMDGYEATRRLRTKEITENKKRIPIIAVTAYATPEDRNKCLVAGMDDYLAKPFTIKELTYILRHWSHNNEIIQNSSNFIHHLINDNSSTIIDLNQIEKIQELDKSADNYLLNSKINSYYEITAQIIDELRAAKIQNDREVFIKLINNLKSISNDIGAKRLSILCYNIEYIICQEQSLSLNEIFQNLDNVLQQTYLSLKKMTNKSNINSTEFNKLKNLNSPLILIIDDDQHSRLLICQILEQDGMQIIEAKESHLALKLFTHYQPDLIVINILMLGIDGFEICTTIRHSENGTHIPILMITGFDINTVIERAYQVGVTDFISKSDNWNLIKYRVRYMLRNNQILEALRHSESQLRILSVAMEQSPNSVLITDTNGNIEYVNPKFCEITGYSQKDVIGQNTRLLRSDKISATVYQELWRTISAGQVWRGVLCNRRKNGEYYWADIIISPIYDYNQSEEILTKNISHFLSLQEDITKVRNQEARIRYLSYFDPLTGLPNRRLFRERLNEILNKAKHNNYQLALFQFDLDHFKRLNDTLGHQVGDQLLQLFTVRINEFTNWFDNIIFIDEEGVHTIARMGEDEFAIIISGNLQLNQIDHVARKLLEQVAHPFNLNGHEIVFGVSIGIIIYPFDGDDSEILLKNVDTAMFNAKKSGRNTYRFYSNSMNESGIRNMKIETNLRRVLEREELLVYYQPQISLHGEQCIIGFEALIRWNNSEMGFISPAEFIPIAEEYDLIIPIGSWIMETACRAAVTWQNFYNPLRVAVNLSARQLRHRELINTVKHSLETTGLHPQYLELEITESVIMHDAPGTIKLLQELKAIGLHLAVDDFGTGYSSLSYLKSFPIDTLKIDRSFVLDITTSSESAHIVTAIIAMGHGLGLKIVAEGVEDQRQLDFLSAKDCDIVQGYLVSRPLPESEVIPFLDKYLNK